MSKSVSVGYTDTAIDGSPVLNLLRGSVNYGADFRVKSDGGSEVVLTNITSPVDRPEKFRFGFSEIANIYSGSDVDPGAYAPTKLGASVLCQLTDIWSVTDSVDPSYRVDLPVSAHLVLKFPKNENITAEMLQTLVARMLSGLYDTGLVTTDRIAAMARGSLRPADV